MFWACIFNEGRTAFGPSNAGIVGLNPTKVMNVCVRLLCAYVVLCVGRDLVTGRRNRLDVVYQSHREMQHGSNGCSARRLIGHWLTRVTKTQNTIEASITLDTVTLTDSLIRWPPNEWPSVCQEIPVSADKMLWTYSKPAKWTPIYILIQL
jgi:hypothetical protein